MTLVDIAPPSTLNVIPGLQNKTAIVPWQMLDRNYTNWSVRMGPTAVPLNVVFDLAMQAAINEIPEITTYATNSSYDLQFYGPSVSCNFANATQASLKYGYTSATDIVYWAALAPTLGPTGWLKFFTELPSQISISEYSN